jgi:hypothetical protein
MVLYNNENMIMGTKNSILNSDGTYTDTENNIRYTIISTIRTIDVAPSTTNTPNISDITNLNPNTRYLMSMTSSNGNGTSIRSNVVLSSTLLDSNIVISIDPITIENGNNYVYPYNAYEPTVLTIRVSSAHSTTPIILSIINATNSNVATIAPVEGSLNTYRVRLENVGTFNLQGRQARGLGEPNSKFGNSITTSPLLTITRVTPTFNPTWNPIPTVLFTRDIVTITPPEFRFPSPVPDEILPITYSYESATAGIITITQPTITQPSLTLNVTINNIGRFRIRATTRESDRYESVFIDSLEYSVTRSQTVTFTGTVNFETIYVNSLNQVITNPVSDGFTIYRVTSTSAGASYVINSSSLSTSVSFLIVGGGGAGGTLTTNFFSGRTFIGGGGGAGGFIESSETTNTATTYSISVGTGGVASTSGANGEESLLQLTSGTLTAIGGGRGGNITNLNGRGGGSGGGGAFINVSTFGTGGIGTLGQGMNGAPGFFQGAPAAGSGGGAQQNGLAGGRGLSSTITGQSIFYAGGGRTTATPPFPTVEGGGGSAGQNGTPNTGGGGGGGSPITSGGSGVVILRIPSFI